MYEVARKEVSISNVKEDAQTTDEGARMTSTMNTMIYSFVGTMLML